MLYDKGHFKKVNDKKVLHKVRKHWVTLSLTTLMLLGGASVVSGLTTHASQIGDNSSNNNGNQSVDTSAENHSSRLINEDNTNTNNESNDQTDQLANRERASINANDQPQGINALNQAQTKFKTDFSTANLLKDNRAYMNDQGRTNQISHPSIDEQQVKSATSEAEYHNQIMAEVREHWNALGDQQNVHPRHLLGAGEENPQTELANLQNQINEISGFQPQFKQNEASLTSASNMAAGEMADYYGVEGVTYNGSDSDASASASAINTDIAEMPTQSMAVDSITASLASSEASDYQANPGSYADQIASLSNKVSALYTEASDYNVDASNSASDASKDANAVYNDFSAERYGALHNNSQNMYPIVNVATAADLQGAIGHDYIHHINVVGNVNGWVADTEGMENPGPLRNLTINGLNDDGTWNTVDFADSEIDFNSGDYTSSKTHPYQIIIKNLHMYGTHDDGPLNASVETAMSPIYADIVYDNITYDGSQLSYNSSPQGAQGTVNINVVFKGKDIVTTGAYSPDGTVGDPNSPYHTGYDYDTGGIPSHPFNGDGALDDGVGDTRNIADPQTLQVRQPQNNINDASNQQDIQVASGRSVIFEPGCNFIGYTSNGDNITANDGSKIQLKPNSQVHLIPRGNYAQPPQTEPYIGKMPVGIDIDGAGSLEVDSGAKLIVTPSDEDNDFNDIDDNFSNINNNYYPGAIYVNATNGQNADIDIKSGGEIYVKYPTQHSSYKNSTESIPDPTLGNNTDTNGDHIDNPSGAITLGGTATIEIDRDGQLIVDGGKPANMNTGSNGALVAMTGGNPGNQVHAEPGSKVELFTAGNQPITLFQAPNGTEIHVNDPKNFQLNFKDNSNPSSQLASPGVGIQGNHVNVHDENGKSYGQYSQTTFPGAIPDWVSGDPNIKGSNGLNQQIRGLWQSLLNAIKNDSNIAHAYSTVRQAEQSTINNVDAIYPYATGWLHNKNSVNNAEIFNHSIDVPRTLLTNVSGQIKSALGHGLSDSDVRQILTSINDPNYASDEPMTYDGTTLYIHPQGFNLEKGFAFTQVPDTYVEGIKINGDIISGYAFPGSYIRMMNYPNGHSHEVNEQVTDPSQPILNPGHMYDDKTSIDGNEAYDPDDKSEYHGDYLTIADSKIGHWSYQLPSDVNPNNVEVIAHTQTVSPDNASRFASDYVAGRDTVDQSDSPEKANSYDGYFNGNEQYINNLPTEVYDDDQTSGTYDPNTGNTISGRGSDTVDDNNAGQDFQAGWFKGTYDKSNLIVDNSIYSETAPFILGYKLAQAVNAGREDDQTLSADKKKIDDATFQYDDYLRRVIADHSAASSNDTSISSTSSDVSSVIKSLNSAPASYSGNLNQTSKSVDNALTSAGRSVANASDQVTAVSSIDSWASGISAEFNGIEADFLTSNTAYNSYYKEALADRTNHDSHDEEASLIAARAVESGMKTDVASADKLATEITGSEASASDDNQSASSDSDSVSTSTLNVEKSASNDIASAFSSSANSYSMAVHSNSSTANNSNTSIGSKSTALSNSGNQISLEYTELSNLESKHHDLADKIYEDGYNVSSASTLASDNNIKAGIYSQVASTANAALGTESSDATALSSNVSSLSTVVSGSVQNSEYTSASKANNTAGGWVSSINSSYATNSSTVSAEWSSINALDDTNASIVMSDALSVAKNDTSHPYDSMIDIYSGIAMGASSAVSNLSSDDSAAIADDSAANAAIAKDSSIVASTESKIANDYSMDNRSDASTQASIAESANFNAQSLANSALGVAATRIVPITFIDNGKSVGCHSEFSGSVGEKAINFSSAVSAPSGYSYASVQPQTKYTNGSSSGTYEYIQNNSYVFNANNIDSRSAGYMAPESVEVVGDEAAVPVKFIDEDGNVVGHTQIDGAMDDSVDIPYGDVPSGYNKDNGQPSQYTFDSKNIASMPKNQRIRMNPYDVYVYKNRTFQFSVNVIEVVNGVQKPCTYTRMVNVTGPDGKTQDIDPNDYVPVGYTFDSSNSHNTVLNKKLANNYKVLATTIDKSGLTIPSATWYYNANPGATATFEFVNTDNNQPVGSTWTVSGDIDQQVNVLAKHSVPSGYKLAPGTNVNWTVTGKVPTSIQKIDVVPEMAENAMINYVEVGTNDVITQRTINTLVGTKLSDISAKYTNEVPYDYKWNQQTSWDNDPDATVADNGQYDVYVTKQGYRPAPVPADSDTKVNKDDGEIIVQYEDKNGVPILTKDTFDKDGTQFLPYDYVNPISMGRAAPNNFKFGVNVNDLIDQDKSSNPIPSSYERGQVQNITFKVSSISSGDVQGQINYMDAKSGSVIQTVSIKGNAGDPINYNQYQQFIPSGYRYVGMGSHDNVLEDGDVEDILVEPAQPVVSLSHITVNYVNGKQNYGTITLGGLAGTEFNLGYYENNLPSRIGNAKVTHVDNSPLSFTDHDQTVNITVSSPQDTDDSYSSVHVYFVHADGVYSGKAKHPVSMKDAIANLISTGSDSELNGYEVSNSQPITMTGHIGDIFTPYAYEYNLPPNTTFNHILTGNDIDSFTKKDQYLVIGVDTTDGSF